MLPLLAEATTPALARPTPAERQALLDLPATQAAHATALGRHLELFDRVEAQPPPAPGRPGAAARIAFWNIERGKYLEASGRVLASLRADALLLCELDLGMARTGQAHTTARLAERLAMGHVFAVEFLELGLGDAREREWHAGEVNQAGLHGAAILSPHALARPAVVRLDADGAWFDGRHGERRVGGRIAVLATLEVGGHPVTLASVHFESHSDPEHRALQLRRLLDAIDDYGPGRPALIGGDLNTSTISRDWARGTGVKPVLPAARVLDPVPFEPLFEAAAARGYEWQRCNTLGVPTQRTRPDGTPAPPLGRIDWFLARGLVATEAATIAAVDAAGQVISDHDILAVTIAPEGA